jgi:cytochrome c oxidase subunit 4
MKSTAPQSPATYVRIGLALMVLLVLTVGAAQLNLGPLSIAIALFIAVIKAMLVAAYFMHLKYEPHLTRVFSMAGVLVILLLLSGSILDVISRGWFA